LLAHSKENQMDWNDVIFSEWFGALGSGVVAAVITAVGLPAPPENHAPGAPQQQMQVQAQSTTPAPAVPPSAR
jgi:hypothetical protein